MPHQNADFHGVAELVAVDGLPGLRLQRVPESVRVAMYEKGARRMLGPDGAEIRFVADGPRVSVTLSAPQADCEIIPFWGGFQHIRRLVFGKEPTTFELEYPERLRDLQPGRLLASPRPGWCDDHPFQPNVWRLCLRGLDKHGIIHFHDLQAHGLRTPHPEEVPAQTLLAYGTSITDGFGATAMHLSFLAQAARRLGMDYVNLGCAGSAYCEPELAEWIGKRDDWDIATLCISINMIGAGFSVDAYRERATYMVKQIAASGRPVVCINAPPYFADVCENLKGPHQPETAAAYRATLRDIVATCGLRNVSLIDGHDLMTSIDGFTIDLAHPSDFGHIQMGENLAAKLHGLTT
ncbi:MAG: SGNH/GDSL hydrolase family protein [Lentisphaeria bacterium]